MKCVHILLVGHVIVQPKVCCLDTAVTLHKEKLWIMFQVIAKKYLIHFWEIVNAGVVLKSVSSLRSALIRIQKLADLCKRGRFKLIKIISIKKDVMFQIPDGLSSLTGSLTIELKILSTFQYQGC